jgi:hypothetical protein
VEGAPLSRRRDRFRAGWVEAAELVAGTASVITRFARPVDVVVIVIDDPVADAGRRLLLGLDGARQAVGADGEPVPPTTVLAGNRAFLAYRVEADAAAGRPVSVTVSSGIGWHVVGVLGATGAPADVTAALAGRGLDSMVGAAVPPGQGVVTLQWLPAAPLPTGVVPERAGKPAAERQPAEAAARKKPAAGKKAAAAKKQAAAGKKQAAAKKAAGKKKAAPGKKKAAAAKKQTAGKKKAAAGKKKAAAGKKSAAAKKQDAAKPAAAKKRSAGTKQAAAKKRAKPKKQAPVKKPATAKKSTAKKSRKRS